MLTRKTAVRKKVCSLQAGSRICRQYQIDSSRILMIVSGPGRHAVPKMLRRLLLERRRFIPGARDVTAAAQ